MSKFLFILAILALPAVTQADPLSADYCPDQVTVTASIDNFVSTDANGGGFQSLSGQTIQVQLVRSQSKGTCILSEANDNQAMILHVSNHHFLEIRTNYTKGDREILFQGYTPDSGKLYLIRADSEINATIDGQYNAELMDGGATHEALAPASLDISVTN